MKIRIDRTRCYGIDRWELLTDGRLILSLETEDLHNLAEAALLAVGLHQELVTLETLNARNADLDNLIAETEALLESLGM